MVKVTISKKTKILIIIILALILGGTGGYLLWRINQEDTVAPADSDAGGSGTAEGTYCCRWKCCDGTWKFKSDTCSDSPVLDCDKKVTAVIKESYCINNGGYSDCTGVSPLKCSCQSWSNGCGVNCTFPVGTQDAVEAAARSSCTAKIAMCNVNTGQYTIETYNSTHVCFGKVESCKNPYAPNPCTTTTNICDNGSWNTKPSGTYEYCENISYSVLATDSDGIDTSSIVVELNNSALTTFGKSSTSTTTTITDTLSTQSDCLDPGSYTLDLSWKDTKGASSAKCTLSTTFTVLEEDAPPPPEEEQDWSITKTATEQCLNEDTEEPTSVVSYVVTVTNNAVQEESIDKIVDVLDTKVLEAYLGDISGEGTFTSGSITWELEGTDEVYTVGQSKTYTYFINIPHDAFGSYTNTVTAYPKEGDSISDDETILADCIITPDEQPQTGIFDSTISKVILGIVMILIGFNLHRITSFVKRVDISLNDMSEERRKKNFERKIVKK